MNDTLNPCPFCGGRAEFERTGTPRWSCIVVCTNCGARHESSDEDDRSGWSWNQRAALAQPEATACPHIRSSGVGDHATHWCALAEQPQPEAQPSMVPAPDGSRVLVVDAAPPPAAPEPSRTLTQNERDVFDAALRRSTKVVAPEPSEAEVAAAMASLHRDMEPAAWPSEDEVTDALRAAAAARSPEPSEAEIDAANEALYRVLFSIEAGAHKTVLELRRAAMLEALRAAAAARGR